MKLGVLLTVALAIAIAIVFAGIFVDYLTLPKSSTEPEVRVTPDIVSYNSYVESDTIDFYVTVGEVSNNFSNNVKSIRVNITYYNEEDYITGRSHGYTELGILEPNQKAPFSVYTTLGSLTGIPARAELSCDALVTYEQSIDGIDITLKSNGTDEYGYYTITGEIQNNGPSRASGIKVVCTYYDSEEDVTVVSHAYPSSPSLNVGSKSTFELSSKPHMIKPSSYKLSIRVVSYEPILDLRYPLFFVLVVVFMTFILYMKKYKGW